MGEYNVTQMHSLLQVHWFVEWFIHLIILTRIRYVSTYLDPIPKTPGITPWKGHQSNALHHAHSHSQAIYQLPVHPVAYCWKVEETTEHGKTPCRHRENMWEPCSCSNLSSGLKRGPWGCESALPPTVTLCHPILSIISPLTVYLVTKHLKWLLRLFSL